MRLKEFIVITILIILLTGSSSEIISNQLTYNYNILINSNSYVPEEEAYIHIAGGFFSVFEGIGGIVFNSKKQFNLCLPKSEDSPSHIKSNCGYIKMKLDRLEYTSRFVYKPMGNLVIQIPGKEPKCFTMEKLDYVYVPGHIEPCYRLSGSLSDCAKPEIIIKSQLICFAEGGINPVLYGGLYITDSSEKVLCYPIRIRGRRENEADNHLHKVIARVSYFSL